MAFSLGMLGIDGAESVIRSERVLGLCHNSELKKAPTRPATELLVSEVESLERILFDDEAWLPDRVAAGHFLLCIYGRLRWSDSQELQHPIIDRRSTGGGYLETCTLRTKTSTTAAKKTSWLPVVCLLYTSPSPRD